MKVLKIVGEGPDALHYVEGGPACGYQSRVDPSPKCHKGRLITPNGVQVLPHIYKDVGECPVCHGTGLLAVELWPDAVKAAWLAKNCRAPLIQPGDGENSNTVITTTDSHQRPYFLAEELNFSAALTAAVIAVAEEEK